MHPKKTVWLWGRHAALAAVQNPRRTCYQIFVLRDLWDTIAPFVGSASVEYLSKKEMDVRFPGAIHQGVAVEVSLLLYADLYQIVECALKKKLPIILLILDQITDPHNVGALLRSAVAFGATGVVFLQHDRPDFTGVLAKSASGALEKISLVQVSNLAQTLRWLQKKNIWCVGLAEDGPALFPHLTFSSPGTAIVVGSEGRGLRRLTRARCDILARLPTQPSFPSLNVSNAGAIALYQVSQQYQNLQR